MQTKTKNNEVMPFNFTTGNAYKGMNIKALMTSSKCREWATFLQWKGAGYKIQKGSKGTGIRTFVKTDKKDINTGKIEGGYVPRYYTLFNKEQVENNN